MQLLKLLILFLPTVWCCTDDLDCSLNGICNKTSSSCVCDAQWYGEYCDLLKILPTIKNNGYKQLNYSSWGGSIIYDKNTNTYNMFAARMSLHCGLTTWKTNSEIIHAISKTNVLGPYIFNKVILNRFSHNPTIHYYNNTYYLYHIGCGENSTNPVQNCINGTTPTGINNLNKLSSGCDGPHWTGLLYSNDGINGEWIPFKDEITLITNHSSNSTTNPCVSLLNNGTIYFVYRQPAQQWPVVDPPNATSERLGISVSSNKYMYNGPFIDITTLEPIENFALEDAYSYIDFRNNFHLITHKKKPNYGPSNGSGGHLFSADGVHWNISRNSPYNNTIWFTDGTYETVGARARPQLIIENGRIHYVSTGVKYGHDTGDYTFTVVQPVYWEED